MRNSEKLLQQSSQEENDFKALSIKTKALREQRLENFEEKYLPKLSAMFEVYEANGKYTIDTQLEQYGVLDYFPKSNALLIRKDNDWKRPGLKWIVENLLKDFK